MISLACAQGTSDHPSRSPSHRQKRVIRFQFPSCLDHHHTNKRISSDALSWLHSREDIALISLSKHDGKSEWPLARLQWVRFSFKAIKMYEVPQKPGQSPDTLSCLPLCYMRSTRLPFIILLKIYPIFTWYSQYTFEKNLFFLNFY